VLAPAAAHLAAGAALGDLGEAVDPSSLAEIRIPEPSVEAGKIACEVLDLNRFGNVQLNVRPSHLAAARLDQADRILVEAEAGGGLARQVATYADLAGDQWGLMVDPRGWLSVVRGTTANAAEGLGVGSGDLVWLSRESE
jgi:S-adenosyl-L-methionine hydrolase (adenosine-forming)